MKPSSDKKTSVFLDRDLSHVEAQRRGENVGRKERIDRKDWKCIKVGEFELHRNNTCSRSLMTSDNGKIQNIHYGDILVKFNEIVSLEQTKIDYLTSDGEDCAPKDYIQNGDIVIADTAEDETVGKMIEVQDVGQHKVVAGLHTIFYRPPSNLFARGWLGYWMNSTAYHSQLNQYMTGIKVLSLSKSCLANTLIQYPPKKEQQQIVAALDSVQRHITSLQALVAKYDAVKKATVKLLLEPKEGWQRLQIKDFAQVYDGTHQTPHYTKSGIPFFSVENVTTNVFPGDKRISLREHRKLTAKFKIRRGDVLMTRIGSIGECRLVDWDYDSSFYVSLAALRFKPNLVLPEYFVTYSTSRNFQEEVNIHSLPFAVPQKINLGPISDIYVSAPPLNEQRKIAARISAIDDALKDCRAQLAKAKSLKQGMMSYFFG